MESKVMRVDTQQIYQERILRVLKHLEMNLDRPTSLVELAPADLITDIHLPLKAKRP